MSGEVTNEAAEEETAIEAVSDATAEEVTEEVVEEDATETEETEEAPQAIQTQEQELPVEPEDNAVRSQMGRKLKYMEEKMDDSFGKLDAFLLSQQQPQYQQPAPQQFQTVDEEEEFITNRNVDSYLERKITQRDEQQNREQTAYENDYLKTTNKFASEVDETEYQAINDEMMTNFNVRYSNDATADAERNWLKAERAVLRKEKANPVRKIPLAKDKPIAPLGGASSQTIAKPKAKTVKFDEATLAYMKSRNIDPEKATKMLSNAR